MVSRPGVRRIFSAPLWGSGWGSSGQPPPFIGRADALLDMFLDTLCMTCIQDADKYELRSAFPLIRVIWGAFSGVFENGAFTEPGLVN